MIIVSDPIFLARPYFAGLTDPRRTSENKLHALQDVLMIVFCAVLSGTEDRVGIALVGTFSPTRIAG
jgi:hypothetical protein